MYLSLAQINGNVQGSQQLPQRVDKATSQERILVQDNLNDVTECIQAEKADFHERHRAPCAGCRSAAVWDSPASDEPRPRHCEPKRPAASPFAGLQSAFCCVWSCPSPACRP